MNTDAQIMLFRGRGIISTLIRWQSRGPWSHAAIELGGEVWEAREFRRVQRRSPRDIIHEALTDGTDISSLRVPVTGEQAEKMRRWLDRQVGKRYDYSSVARFVSRRQARRESAEVWFCSELVFAAFRHVDIHLFHRTEPWEVSPSMLARTPLAGPLETIVKA